MASARSAPAASADAGGLQAAPAHGESGRAARGRLRGSSVVRLREPGAPGYSGRQPPGHAHAPARHLPARASARLGEEELLHATPDRSAIPRDRKSVLEAKSVDPGGRRSITEKTDK